MLQRVFGNKVYFLEGKYRTKSEAAKKAKQMREGRFPWFVRVVPSGDGYQVWRR